MPEPIIAAGTPPAGTPPAGTPPAGTPPVAPPWHGFADTAVDDIAYVSNKGWKGPQDVITSYRNAEKVIGKSPDSLLVVPRADDPDGFRAVMQKLGLPETPDKYEFAKPEGGAQPDESYVAWARNTFHKLGLTAGQVAALSKEHNAYVAQVMAQQEKDYGIKVEGEKAALLKEWGAGHERMMAASKHAANALGFTQADIDALERTRGYAETYKFFANLGQKMGEDGLVTKDGGGKPGFGNTMTPADAKAEYEAMKLDPVMQAALTDNQHPGHKAAIEKKSRLFAIMFPQ